MRLIRWRCPSFWSLAALISCEQDAKPFRPACEWCRLCVDGVLDRLGKLVALFKDGADALPDGETALGTAPWGAELTGLVSLRPLVLLNVQCTVGALKVTQQFAYASALPIGRALINAQP